MASVGAFGNPQAAMEAAVLVHNVTRIVQVLGMKIIINSLRMSSRFLEAGFVVG